jgi:hypothetical protein
MQRSKLGRKKRNIRVRSLNSHPIRVRSLSSRSNKKLTVLTVSYYGCQSYE